MERWSKSYLLLDENDYGYMRLIISNYASLLSRVLTYTGTSSPNIARVFGRPGPSDGQGLQIIDFFIDQIQANFMLWNADPDVLLQVRRVSMPRVFFYFLNMNTADHPLAQYMWNFGES